MAKLRKGRIEDTVVWLFFCPGCKCRHGVREGRWTFNGDLDAPTLNPSIITQAPGLRCHSFVRDGMIQFLDDCTHDLRGQTVPLPDV